MTRLDWAKAKRKPRRQRNPDWADPNLLPTVRGGTRTVHPDGTTTITRPDPAAVADTIRKGTRRNPRTGDWRYYNAKWAGTCEICTRSFAVLDPIVHKPGHTRHRTCHDKQRTRT